MSYYYKAQHIAKICFSPLQGMREKGSKLVSVLCFLKKLQCQNKNQKNRKHKTSLPKKRKVLSHYKEKTSSCWICIYSWGTLPLPNFYLNRNMPTLRILRQWKYCFDCVKKILIMNFTLQYLHFHFSGLDKLKLEDQIQILNNINYKKQVGI